MIFQLKARVRFTRSWAWPGDAIPSTSRAVVEGTSKIKMTWMPIVPMLPLLKQRAKSVLGEPVLERLV